MQQVIEKGGILLDRGDAADMTSLFHEVAPAVEERFLLGECSEKSSSSTTAFLTSDK